MYVYLYTCQYVYIGICISIYVCIYTTDILLLTYVKWFYVHVYVYVWVCVYMNIYMCVYAHILKYVCMYVFIYMYLYIYALGNRNAHWKTNFLRYSFTYLKACFRGMHLHTWLYVYVHTCPYVSMYLCIHTCMHVHERLLSCPCLNRYCTWILQERSPAAWLNRAPGALNMRDMTVFKQNQGRARKKPATVHSTFDS